MQGWPETKEVLDESGFESQQNNLWVSYTTCILDVLNTEAT
jgi:hypothetical protein